jgi:hypothetical protein
MEKEQKQNNTAAITTCIFRHLGEISFAKPVEKDGDVKNGKFGIVGYSGQIIPQHWYWGNLAFDLGGLQFAKKPTPILEDHLSDKRIGVTVLQEITDKVFVEGVFLGNANAQQLRSDMRDGFPMEASLYVPPSIIERIEEGESVQVNGHTLNGPGTVFRKATIKEISICTFGADNQTISTAFAESGKQLKFTVLNDKENIMSDKMTKEKFAAEYPDLLKEIISETKAGMVQEISAAKASGAKETRELFGKFAEQFFDDPALCVEQFKAGVALNDAIVAQNAKLKKQLSEKQPPKTPSKKVDPAIQEFSDEQNPPQTPVDETEKSDNELKEKYAADKKLQDEFGKVENYIAYFNAVKSGQVRLPRSAE